MIATTDDRPVPPPADARTGFRTTASILSAVYLAGLLAWAIENELAYAVAVLWFVSVAAALVAGVLGLPLRRTRPAACGALAAATVALGLELVVTAVVWGLWLQAHPGWQLS